MSRLLRKLRGYIAQDRDRKPSEVDYIAQDSSRKPCGVCRSQIIRDANHAGVRDNHMDYRLRQFAINPSILKKSARNGCPWCAILWRGIARFRDLEEEEDIDIVVEIDPDFRDGGFDFDLDFRGPRPGFLVVEWGRRGHDKDLTIEFYNPAGNNGKDLFGPEYDSSVLNNSIPKKTNSPECFEFIKTCVSNCIQNHYACKQQHYWPKRVIDVRGLGEDSVVLLEPTAGLDGSYIALSHCWGTGRMFKTTIASKKQRMRNIRLTELPRTFRHAITVTRKLDVRYLWIDSLCIIQDDAEDWALQSAEMAAIYSNSYLTIAASFARDSSRGLFRKRRILSHTVEVQHPSDGAPVISMMVRKPEDRILFEKNHNQYEEWFHPNRIIHNSDLETHKMLQVPLLSRGWAFQERLLSTRILHFTPLELIFECKNDFHCECSSMRKESITAPIFSCFTSKYVDLPNTWQKLVATYKTQQLTKRSDTFPALSGLAKAISDRAGASLGPYCAGLWGNYLHDGLCWSVAGEAEIDEEDTDEKYIAPSWSWASICGRVTWHGGENYEKDDKFELLSLNCVAKGHNLLGELKQGSSIVVRANIVPAIEIMGKSEGSVWYKLLSTELNELGEQHPAEEPPNRLYPELMVCFDVGRGSVMRQAEKEKAYHFYCMALRVKFPASYLRDYSCDLIVQGLAVQKVFGASETYKRIGIFYAEGPLVFEYFKYGEGSWKNKAEYKDITLI